ncbi:hypothetical protein KKC13_05685 [bacterium]|nr:hypothetical protein [bacterium]MBU1957340.1 hypothetical protein [bacterium]
MKKMITTCMAAAVVLTSNAVAEFNFDKAPEKLTTYYASALQPLDAVKSKLTANGFEILATTEILKGETVITITNNELKATNSYMATIQVLVNTVKNEIRVQNPSYLGAAYLQDKYQYGQFKATLTALEASLGTMNDVEEKHKFKELAGYRFMFGMPYLEDTIEIAKGDNLVEKLTAPEASKYIAYSVKLPNGATLVGHKLNKRTNKFLKKIEQEHNAQLLPYEAMIKDGKVTILDPKYYLALSLPLLSMTEFMKIATAPDQIAKDIKKAYK